MYGTNSLLGLFVAALNDDYIVDLLMCAAIASAGWQMSLYGNHLSTNKVTLKIQQNMMKWLKNALFADFWEDLSAEARCVIKKYWTFHKK